MINALTIDYEDWYQVPLANVPVSKWDDCASSLEETTPVILDFLERFSIKSTFFVVGYIADRHPELIKAIHRAGHDIQSHGYWHQLAYLQSEEEFAQDISMSVKAIESIIGRRPIGYRAPAWSTTKMADRSIQVLQKNGFAYDSSFMPASSFLFDGRGLPKSKYIYKDSSIIEYPPSVAEICGLNIPATGGFYMRVYPKSLLSFLIRKVNKTRPAILYFHPWEVLNNYPRQKIKPHHHFIQYFRCGTILKRLDYQLKRFRFGSMLNAFPELVESKKRLTAKA